MDQSDKMENKDNKKKSSIIDIVKSKGKGGGLGKDKLLIALLAGVLLLVIAIPAEEAASDGDGQDTEGEASGASSAGETSIETLSLSYEEELEKKLEDFLSQVEGVGQVRVLIKTEGSQEKVVEKDIPVTQSSQEETDESGNTRSVHETQSEEATVYEDAEYGQRPFVVKEYAPKIEGVIIAAEGGDQPEVAAQITEGVQALLQIEVHKIEVLKLKGNGGT